MGEEDNTNDFKEKARRHLFNSSLREFPVVFEMYTRSFDLVVDLDASMSEIITIVRTSEDASAAYAEVCRYLDSLEALFPRK